MQMKMAFPLAFVMAAALSATPALAQKGGHGHDDGRGHHESDVRGRRDSRDDDRRDVRRRDDRRDDRRWRSSSNRRLQRRVPAGWCIGRGNPHNTVANCGPGANRYNRRFDPRYNRSGSWNRNGSNGTWNRNGTNGTYGTNGRQGYDLWKRSHDQRCHDLSRQRPLDLRWQQQVRNQCSNEDREARRRYGV